MSTVAPIPRARRQSRREAQMSKERKDVYLGEGLKRALKGAPGTLSTNVNLFADRYMGVVERMRPSITNELLLKALKAVIVTEARGHRLEAREIAALPSMVEDWLQRSGLNMQSTPNLRYLSFAELVALVDFVERQQ